MKNHYFSRTWIIFANREKCRHSDAIHETGSIYWSMKSANFSVGDTVYLFLSNERRIAFKMKVTAENVIRQDVSYWTVPVSGDKTFHLELEKEYFGNELNEAVLNKHGFKGGKSIERPMCNNVELNLYVQSVFDKVGPAHVIISCDPEKFDAISAFRNLDSVFWIQSQPMTNIHTNDIVYIYVSGAIGKILLKCKVGNTKLPYSKDVDKDKPYWGKGHSLEMSQDKKYMELFLLQENKSSKLTLADLRAHGEVWNMQGIKRISGSYLDYIDSCFPQSNVTYIQDLLKGKNKDFDLSSKIKLIRHTTPAKVFGKDFDGTISDLYNDSKLFSMWQNHQRMMNFENVDFIVSFIAESGTDSLFVGVYRNKGLVTTDSEISGFYDFEEMSEFSDLKEKVIIRWNNPRAWHQWYNNKMEVIEQIPTEGHSAQQPASGHFEQFHLNTDDRIRHIQETETVVEAYHQKMQEAIKPILEREGYTEIVMEEDHVDIRANWRDVPHFFELKTYDSAKACIREAIGQILEYAHYPQNSRATELIIVGPAVPTDDDKRYLKTLRDRYNLRLYYRYYNDKEKYLSPKF